MKLILALFGHQVMKNQYVYNNISIANILFFDHWMVIESSTEFHFRWLFKRYRDSKHSSLSR